jgi:hypothetical protein
MYWLCNWSAPAFSAVESINVSIRFPPVWYLLHGLEVYFFDPGSGQGDANAKTDQLLADQFLLLASWLAVKMPTNLIHVIGTYKCNARMRTRQN